VVYSLKIYQEHTYSPSPHRVVVATDSFVGTSKGKSRIAKFRCF